MSRREHSRCIIKDGSWCFIIIVAYFPCLIFSWSHHQTIKNNIPEVTEHAPIHPTLRSPVHNALPGHQYLEAKLRPDQIWTHSRRHRRKRPHIVFILADDMGYSDIGYHDDNIRTPNIDHLAQNGVKFENYYSQQICAPSRAVLLTGKYVSHHMLGHNISPRDAVCLSNEHHLLPQELKRHGYSTHMVGKWHLGRSSWGCLPEKRGFDSFLGIHGGGASYVGHSQRYNDIHRGYALYNGSRAAKEHKGVYAPTIYVKRSTRLIERHSGTDSKPLFLLLATQLVHSPNFDVPAKYLDNHTHHKGYQRMFHSAQATILDGVVADVVASLKKNKMWKRTILIFSSDNGGSIRYGGRNNPLRGWKSEFFEGGIRVPAFMTSPLLAKASRGTTFRGLMGISDWYSTIIKGILRKDISHLDLDSVNVWLNIKNGRSQSPRNQYLYSIGSTCFPNKVDNRTAYRWKEWKYMDLAQGNYSIFLFNITADPFERNNLAMTRPDMVGIIQRKIIRNFCDTARHPMLPNEVEESSPVHSNGILKPWMGMRNTSTETTK